MAIPLEHYAKIKGNYCVAYMGDDQNALELLLHCRPQLEERYPGLHIYISAKDHLIQNLLTDGPRIIRMSKINEAKSQLAYLRLIESVDEFLKESGLGA